MVTKDIGYMSFVTGSHDIKRWSGGRDRTGSRTPMQWNTGVNLGFSESNKPYLPVDSASDAPTVEKQLTDDKSILNFIRRQIALRKSHAALQADGTFGVIYSGYPVVYERSDAKKRIRVIINASDRLRIYPDEGLKEILFTYNADYSQGIIHTGGRGCMIYTI